MGICWHRCSDRIGYADCRCGQGHKLGTDNLREAKTYWTGAYWIGPVSVPVVEIDLLGTRNDCWA